MAYGETNTTVRKLFSFFKIVFISFYSETSTVVEPESLPGIIFLILNINWIHKWLKKYFNILLVSINFFTELTTSTTTEALTAGENPPIEQPPQPEQPSLQQDDPPIENQILDRANAFFDNVGEQTRPVEDFAKDLFGRKRR